MSVTARSVRDSETTDAHKQAELAHTEPRTAKHGEAHAHARRQTHKHLEANTEQLSGGFQNKGINHHYTHTHKRTTWVGRGWRALGLIKETH